MAGLDDWQQGSVQNMRRLIRPIAGAARSFLGIDGLLLRLAEVSEKLVILDTKLATCSAPPRDYDALAVPCATQDCGPNHAAKICALDYVALTGDPPVPQAPPTAIRRGSRMCRQGDYATDAFRYWMAAMRQPPIMQRKMWEWFFIADALFQHGVLRPNSSGIAFGVGQEPLPSLFAAMGVNILATDMSPETAGGAGWVQSGEHAAELDTLNIRGICETAVFKDRARFRTVDMNDIPVDLNGQFEFCWSSCAFEHLGSLEHGMRFVEQSMRVLKPGGIAVHTTEYNMSSDHDTLELPRLSLYRRRDLEALTARLEAAGHRVEPYDWDQGRGYADGYIDLPPYFSTPLHLRLRIASFDCTSIGMIIHKGQGCPL